ncbi:MAG: polysaccharide biosynthesis/export family protein [Candidatus Nealsonbacteria bacterium]|nr:polysaccharide biosynthesis/export family protein [Candidatus Nealsonbacteria bacterium]
MPLLLCPSRQPVGRLLLLTTFTLVIAVAGCSQSHYYLPATIPNGYRAIAAQNAQTLDLSGFAGPPVNHELIDRGDLLSVSIAAGLNEDAVTEFIVRVGSDGTAIIPEIGILQLAGMPLMAAEEQIATACIRTSMYRQPHVTVRMNQPRVNRVTVLGAVENPGTQSLSRKSSYLMGAIMAAGGLAEDAGTDVEIRRPMGYTATAFSDEAIAGPGNIQLTSGAMAAPGGQVSRVCLNLAAAAGKPQATQYLEDGTVVMIQRCNPERIEVIGLVGRPDRYDFPINHDLRLLGAIALAGGASSKLADEVIVTRKDSQGQAPVGIKISLRKAKSDPNENIRLAPGDIVSVEPNVGTAAIDALQLIRFGVGASLPLPLW